MAPHSSTLAWKISWTEEPFRFQPMRSLRVGHDSATSLSLFTSMHWRRKWQPTPVFLPEESQGQRSLVGCRLWGRTESNMTEVTQQQQQQEPLFSIGSPYIYLPTICCSKKLKVLFFVSSLLQKHIILLLKCYISPDPNTPLSYSSLNSHMYVMHMLKKKKKKQLLFVLSRQSFGSLIYTALSNEPRMDRRKINDFLPLSWIIKPFIRFIR